MAEDSSIILTSVEVDTRAGIAGLKTFEKQAEQTAANVQKSLGEMDDGLSPLRELLQKSRRDGEAFEKQIADLRGTSQVASTAMISGFGAVGLGIGGVGIAAATSAIAVGMAADALGRFAEAAGPVTQLAQGFETLTARTGETAEAFLQKARPATQGLVSDLELMKATNRAILLDLPVTSQTMAELAGGAVKLGRAMGVDAVKSVDSLIEGIGRQSPRLLDNIGIIVRAKEVYKAYADQLGISVDALSDFERKQAFTQAALDSVREKTEGLTSALPPFSEEWQRTSVIAQNVEASFLRVADQVGGRMLVALGEGGAAALGFGDKVLQTVTLADLQFSILGGRIGQTMEESKARTGEFAAILLQLAPPLSSLVQLLGLVSSGAPAAAQKAAAVVPKFEPFPDERRDEGFQDKLDKSIKGLDDAQHHAAFLRDQLAHTFDPKLVALISQEISALDTKIKNLLGGKDDDKAKKLHDRLIADEARFQEQLLQVQVAAAVKGSEEQEALQARVIEQRYNREIAAAKIKHEDVSALEKARDLAVANNHEQALSQRAIADLRASESLTQTRLQSESLGWDERLALQEDALTDATNAAIEAEKRGDEFQLQIYREFLIKREGLRRQSIEARLESQSAIVPGMIGDTGIHNQGPAQPAEDLAAQQRVIQETVDTWGRLQGAQRLAEQGIVSYTEAVKIAGISTQNWASTMQDALGASTQQAAVQLGNTIVDAAFGAKVSWGETIKSILEGIARAIVQAYILKAIELAFGLSGGGVVGSTAATEVPIGGFAATGASGGVAPALYAASGAQAQNVFRPRGTDTVPAMLTPGELVIPRKESAEVLSGRTSISSPRAGQYEPGSRSIVGGKLTATPTGSAPRQGADVYQALASLSRSVERSIAGGSAPRNVNLTVNAIDKRGVREALLENTDALAEALDYLDARAG